MSEINLIPEQDIDRFITIVENAYPDFDVSAEEKRQKFKQRLIKLQKEDETSHLYGLYREGNLLGGMLLLDFTMNVFSHKIRAGGVGLVAVDLIHKKEKVCKEMISYFLNHYREKGACITLLHPFRPDFYKEMGFGFGTKMHQYILKPAQLPQVAKEHIQLLDKTDKQALQDCYDRCAEKTHGMILGEKGFRSDRFFDDPQCRIVGYKKGDNIQGFLVFTFKKGSEENFLINDIEVREFMYENRDAFLELLTFLHIQKDQIRHIILNTADDHFHHLLPDPRDFSTNKIPHAYHECNTSGVGLMFRVIDVKKLFRTLESHNFGGIDCRLNLMVRDNFLKENEGAIVIHFEKGTPHLDRKGFEVEVTVDVSEFSSLVMGVIPFRRLYHYGLAEISDLQYVNKIERIFRTEEKPVCTTDF